MLTLNEVQSQKERFEAFMNSANLAKIGKTWCSMPPSDSNGRYTQYCYIHKVLKQLANVGSAYWMAEHNKSYGEVLTCKALHAYIDTVK